MIIIIYVISYIYELYLCFFVNFSYWFFFVLKVLQFQADNDKKRLETIADNVVSKVMGENVLAGAEGSKRGVSKGTKAVAAVQASKQSSSTTALSATAATLVVQDPTTIPLKGSTSGSLASSLRHKTAKDMFADEIDSEVDGDSDGEDDTNKTTAKNNSKNKKK